MIGFFVDFAVPGTCVTWLRKSFSLKVDQEVAGDCEELTAL